MCLTLYYLLFHTHFTTCTQLLLCVTSNVLGVVTVPLMLAWLTDLDAEGLEVTSLMIRLAYSVLAPSLAGFTIRQMSPRARRFTNRHTFALKVTASVALACLPWMAVSKANDDGALKTITVQGVFDVIGYFIIIHVLFVVSL